MKEKEIQAEDAPRPKKWLRRLIWVGSGISVGSIGLLLALVTGFVTGYGCGKDGKPSSSEAQAASSASASAGVLMSSALAASSTTRRDCDGDHFADCRAVPSSEFKISAPGTGLDCRGGRMRLNADKTWNLCDCPCQSQVEKN